MLAIATHNRIYLPHLQYGLWTAYVCAQKEDEVVNYMVLGMIMLHTAVELIMNKPFTDDSFSKNKLHSIPMLVTNKPSTSIFVLYIFSIKVCTVY